MRTGAGLRVELDGKCRLSDEIEPFDSAVVGVDVAYFKVRLQSILADLGACPTWMRGEHALVGILYCEAVVLAGDVYSATLQVDHGLICTPVAVAQLVGVQTGRQPHQLVAEADSHHRHVSAHSSG